MDRIFIAMGGLLGFLGVMAGAFGAHALKARLAETPHMAEVFETAVRYQMYHALALVAVGLIIARAPSGAANAAGWAFLGGIGLFSGSLYVLALTGIHWLGAVTPFGGLGFLGGWVALALAAWQLR